MAEAASVATTRAGPSKGAVPAAAGENVAYMPQLDGIRALAVTGVIIEHWGSGMPLPVQWLVAHLDLGGWGVDCFFVLSGFLITSILLDTKARKTTFSAALGHFYGRRTLRIFPAYYLVLAVVAACSATMREVLPWHLFYLGNWYPLWHGNFAPSGGHFWSLAVEEQFYLVWPLVVLLTPWRRIGALAVAIYLAAPITRWLLWLVLGHAHLAMWTLPTSAMDLLALGALLAWLRSRGALAPGSEGARRLGLAGAAALVGYAALFIFAHHTIAFPIFGRSLLAWGFGAIVLGASSGFTSLPGRWLGLPVVRWIGTVSYGLYLIHPFVPPLYLYLLQGLNLSPQVWGEYPVRMPLMTLILFALVSSSYYLWERPIRSLRLRLS